MIKKVLVGLVVMMSLLATKCALTEPQVLYEDNFTTLDPAWGEINDKQSVKDGKLVVQPEIGSTWTALNQGMVFQDMNAHIKVRMAKSDDPSMGGGLVFWGKDYNDYYYIVENCEGEFAVKRWLNNRILTPVDWRANPTFKKGIGEWNQLGIVTKGNQATVYINDTEAVTFKGQPPEGGGFVGIRVSSPDKSKIVWEFGDLKITKP